MFSSFTEITQAVNFAFLFTLVISLLLLVLITVLMVGFVIRYHRSRHPVPAKTKSHTLLEVTWTVIPTLLALGMFYFGWMGYRLMKTPPANAMEVKATGMMWSWQFDYENGKQSAEMYVPVGVPVKVNLASRDVLHSFYLPAFMVKQDCVPGLETFVWFEPKEMGEYDIFCTEYCGQRHSYMITKLRVVSQAEFDEWVEKDVVIAEVDEGASEADRVAQLVRIGQQLSITKGCNACHSVDGSKLVGPTYKGLFGKSEVVVTDGQERQVVVDEEYLKRSILQPAADIVTGYQPLMPSQEGLVNDRELDALVEYIKSIN